ncbi:acyl-CoA Delta-9 desaturase-like [Zophobas morio]|uniref:acyl-CoA Delta-9 desaturase-like n=1 Tax=Zophobas morio TaxID=2755281 RepID=UPI00308340DF
MSSTSSYKLKIVWPNVLVLFLYHYFAILGIYYIFSLQIKLGTVLFMFLLGRVAGLGITMGAHRLWCHKAYKAKLPLRIILCFLQTVTFQNCIYEWCRDHRVHHKFTDTDADPHNINRGFFFSHMGWLMVRKHPDVTKLGKTVNMSDLEADPVVRFQKKFYVVLAPVFSFVVPTMVPWYFWNEDLYVSFCTAAMFRYVVSLHFTWLVNSAAHIWGTKPYNRSIKATENKVVSSLTWGEGWHNYHHVFPWDYKAAELGTGDNFSATCIEMMAKIGWAYDLRTASPKMIQERRDTSDTGSETSY